MGDPPAEDSRLREKVEPGSKLAGIPRVEILRIQAERVPRRDEKELIQCGILQESSDFFGN